MIYTCEKCRFTFSRVGQVESCPDCGKPFVREATEKEQKEYQKNRAMIEEEKKKREY